MASPVGAALPFDQRACFIAGTAKSGTTLLVALLDSHPELLVLPEETAYFPTVLTKYGPAGRRAQFDYLTRKSLANVLFGGDCKWGEREYGHLPTRRLRAEFERTAFDPGNAPRDLLAVLMECYAAILGRPLDAIRRWVEKTPANRAHVAAIFQRFPHARMVVTLRDPRALLAAQVQLEQSRQQRRFSVYLTVKNWRTSARLALLQRDGGVSADKRLIIVPFEGLLDEPVRWMERVCGHLEISYHTSLLEPTKAGRPWTGNSSATRIFQGISSEPADRWKSFLTRDEIGWVEWHCRDLMEPLGYKPTLPRRSWRHWARPVRGETLKEYCKSRLYSLRPWPPPQSWSLLASVALGIGGMVWPH